jgi:hypothetical protein
MLGAPGNPARPSEQGGDLVDLEREKAAESIRLRARYAAPGNPTRTIGETFGPADGAALLQEAIDHVRAAGGGEAWVEVSCDPDGSGTWVHLVGVSLRHREETVIDVIGLSPGALPCGSATSLLEAYGIWPVDLSPLAARILARALQKPAAPRQA